jgi:endonuclease/exonuclease/phosphatase (EEP) superfamily protein YafD
MALRLPARRSSNLRCRKGAVGRLDREQLRTIAAWVLVAPWAIWALVRTLGIGDGYPIEALLAFTPIVAATAIVPVGVAAALRRPAAVAVAGISLALLVAAVVPRAFGGRTEAAGGGGAELRVMAANMKLGKADPEALVALCRELEVDLLSVEELTPVLSVRLQEAGLDEVLPHSVVDLGPGATGSGLFATTPLDGRSVERLPGGFPLIGVTVTLPGAATIQAYGLHTVPPVSDTVAEWKLDLAAVPAPSESLPTVVLGDFNATLDHAEFRDVLDRGYEDVASTLGEGLTGTWPMDRRMPPFAAIDHVLADDRIGVAEYSLEEIPRSDHRVVFAELVLPAG